MVQAGCADDGHGRHTLAPRSGEHLKRRIQGFGSEPAAPALPDDSLWGALVEVGVAMGVATKEEMEDSMVAAKDGFEELADAASSFFDLGPDDPLQNSSEYPPNVVWPLSDAGLKTSSATELETAGASVARRKWDGPGQYHIISDDAVMVSGSCALGGKPVGTLTKGDVVLVLGLAECPGRLRARIAQPSGWISILNLETGFRFAQRQEHAEKECSGKERSTGDRDSEAAGALEHRKGDEAQCVHPTVSTSAVTPSANERQVSDFDNSDLLGDLDGELTDQVDLVVPKLHPPTGEILHREKGDSLFDVAMEEDAEGWTPFVCGDGPLPTLDEEEEWSPFESAAAPVEDTAETGAGGLHDDSLAADLSVDWSLPSTMGVGSGLSAVTEEVDDMLVAKGCEKPARWQHHGYAFNPSLEQRGFDPLAVKSHKFPPPASRGLSIFDPCSAKNVDIIAALGD